MTALPPSPGQERAKRTGADEIIDYMGLKRYADHFVATLSTGTRRRDRRLAGESPDHQGRP